MTSKYDFSSVEMSAPDETSELGRTDVVEYLCGLTPFKELFLPSGTPLHHTEFADVAEVLIKSISSENLEKFLLHPNYYELAALEVAATDEKYEVVEYLCGLKQVRELMANGKLLPLHYTTSDEVTEIVVESFDPEP